MKGQNFKHGLKIDSCPKTEKYILATLQYIHSDCHLNITSHIESRYKIKCPKTHETNSDKHFDESQPSASG